MCAWWWGGVVQETGWDTAVGSEYLGLGDEPLGPPQNHLLPCLPHLLRSTSSTELWALWGWELGSTAPDTAKEGSMVASMSDWSSVLQKPLLTSHQAQPGFQGSGFRCWGDNCFIWKLIHSRSRMKEKRWFHVPLRRAVGRGSWKVLGYKERAPHSKIPTLAPGNLPSNLHSFGVWILVTVAY